MSSQSQDNSYAEEPHQSRLTSIWNSIQKTKNLSQMIDRNQHNPRIQRLSPTHLDSNMHGSPSGDREYKQNLVHLLKKVRSLQEQNHSLRNNSQKDRQGREVETAHLKRDYEDKLRGHLSKQNKAEKQNITFNKETGEMGALARQNEKLVLRIKSMEHERRSYQVEVARLKELNEVYLQQVTEGKGTRRAEVGRGEQLLELEDATQAVCRLVDLLRRTEEYRQFAPLMQEVKDLHYLKNVLKRLKANQLNVKPIEKKMCSCKEIKINEKLLWSPIQCYRTMLELKVKYDYLSEDCIEEVLFEMNRIYTAREERTLQKFKNSHLQDIIKLKKQIQHGYDQILTKKQITRLKRELRVVKSAQKSRAPPRLEQLRDKGQLEDHLKLRDREIKLLKERIKLFQTETGFQDRSLYYEGILYALEKVLSELDSNEAGLKEFEVRFRQRVEENMDPEDWLRSYKQFFQTLGELSGNLVGRVLGLKESTLKKMHRGQ